jgi:hypothetical protein
MRIVIISLAICALAIFSAGFACSVSTANLGDLKTSTDKDGKSTSSSFKSGDTLYGAVPVKNNPGKVKVKFTLVAEDVKDLKKGDTLKGSDVSVDIDGDGTASYNVPVSAGFPGGKYKLNADMINEQGEKKDSKTVDVTVAQTTPPAAETKADDEDDK